MYDLTALLTTLAAISAAMVAILGGFIFSRYITISTQRKEINTQEKSIRDDIESIEGDIKKLETINKDYEFIFFLASAISLCLNDQILLDMDSEGNLPYCDVEVWTKGCHFLKKEELPGYWSIAQKICEEIRNLPEDEVNRLDSMYVPLAVKKTYEHDDLRYAICNIVSNIMLHQREPDRFPICIEPTSTQYGYAVPYNINRETIEKKNASIEEKNDLICKYENKKNESNKSDNIIGGLVIFGLVILFCVIAPVFHIQFTTDSKIIYSFLKYWFLITFSIGIIAIFVYLIILVKGGGKNSNSKIKTGKNPDDCFADNSWDK